MDYDLMSLCYKFCDNSNIRLTGNALHNAFLRGGIRTIDDLKNSSKQDILNIRHVGEKKLKLIMDIKNFLSLEGECR